MDMLDVLLQAGLITAALVAYLLVFRRETPKRGNYKEPGWNYPLKLLYARYAVTQWKRKLRRTETNEWPNPVPIANTEGWDAVSVRATAPDGTTVLLGARMLYKRQLLSEINVHHYQHGWSANGLKFQVLEPERRMRITYNGLLTRDDGTTQHVRLNLIGQKSDGGWLQFGSMQGRFESYDEEGVTDRSVYLQTRGLKERSWAPQGYKELRRSVRITVSSVDGTVVHLRCLSYRNVLMQ
ncbi:putative phosphoenolpyruvate synthase [Operophtera brumata]|uniref:Putative phosphoenolpyruvate synthase n=1 Tax=Operophtera brumata TaxID=104452 RepID=A0A0L7LTP0_OPEBR|nr:putative phosphoenolpyruvate synthase [Operophtera brumata]